MAKKKNPLFTCVGNKVRHCTFNRGPKRGHSFVLHAGKSNKAAKRGRAQRVLKKHYRCYRNAQGQFMRCVAKRGHRR